MPLEKTTCRILPPHDYVFGLRFFCFGPSGTQQNFLSMLSNLIPAQITKQNAALDPLAAFGQSRMTGGLPEFNALKDFSTGTVAQNSAPARGSLLRSMARSGMRPGDPASQGILSDFNASRSR